jgi:hypothetical protein
MKTTRNIAKRKILSTLTPFSPTSQFLNCRPDGQLSLLDVAIVVGFKRKLKFEGIVTMQFQF